jgi:TetR/AcrR family transcriptional repressor of nem operon
MANDGIRERILDAAERRAQRGGYNAFSFRELAADVGVKSSSVHYHFATKEALLQALVERYCARTRERLGEVAMLSPDEALRRLTAIFREALVDDNRMCLCGLLAAERDGLPPNVDAAVADYFRMILAYLRAALGDEEGRGTPEAVLATLEGALIVARSLCDHSIFERAVAQHC